MKKLGAMFDGLINICFGIACAVVFFQTLATCVNTLSRYFLNMPILGIESFSEWGLLYIAFLGAAYLLKKEKHITVDILLGKMSARSEGYLMAVTSFVSMIVFLIIMWEGWAVTWEFWINHYDDMNKLTGFPKATILVIIPFCSLLFAIQFGRRAYNNLIKANKAAPQETAKFTSDTPY